MVMLLESGTIQVYCVKRQRLKSPVKKLNGRSEYLANRVLSYSDRFGQVAPRSARPNLFPIAAAGSGGGGGR